jgi:hypothetical protein
MGLLIVDSVSTNGIKNIVCLFVCFFSEFVQMMDFKHLAVDEGLREFQSHFRMTVSDCVSFRLKV